MGYTWLSVSRLLRISTPDISTLNAGDSNEFFVPSKSCWTLDHKRDGDHICEAVGW